MDLSFLEAIILGLVQGLTEFLPISSSGHLIVIPWLFNFPSPGLEFDVALHLGTLVAVLVYFRNDFISMARAIPRALDHPLDLMKSPAENSRDEALRQEAWLKVGRERLRQQEVAGNLVRADLLAEALVRAGREIQSTVARLPNSADDLALAVSKEGAHGLRVALREKAFEVNTKIAELLANLAVQAREHDPAIEETEA